MRQTSCPTDAVV